MILNIVSRLNESSPEKIPPQYKNMISDISKPRVVAGFIPGA